MLNRTVAHLGLGIFAVALTACTTNQDVTPSESAHETPPVTVPNQQNNPYYSTNTQVAPQTYTAPNIISGSYVPSTAPVDLNAATHTVVKGDTIYNLAKRYHISQDDLLAWNNLSDYNIQIGQVLRVKPAGYQQPSTNNTIVTNPTTTVNVPQTQTYTVVHGDTLYSIARRFNISPAELVRWNNIANGDHIFAGQKLKINTVAQTPPTQTAPTTGNTTSPTTSNTTVTPPPATPKLTTTVPADGAKTRSSGTRTVNGITWQNPVSGSILQNFGGNSKGINFGGNTGQAIVAAADGKVVYSGSGLRGYGNLVIIQHNKTYLTAYGNNQSLSVKEGQSVKRGQFIASMGNSDANRTQLHFELRENGKPVDPRLFLPM